AGYVLFKLGLFVFSNVSDAFATGIPVSLPDTHISWLYVSSSMMPFLIVTIIGMTSVAILLGQNIANNRIGLRSLFYYFTLFGFVAPIWLARAAWGALTAQESAWR